MQAATLHLLNSLVASESTQSMDVRLGVQQLPQALSTVAGQGVLDLQAAAELLNILLGIQARNTLPALVVGRGSKSHVPGLLMCQRKRKRLGQAD
jgi:hypothetical protein